MAVLNIISFKNKYLCLIILSFYQQHTMSSTLTNTNFFKQLIDLYKHKNSKEIVSKFKHLFETGSNLELSSWEQQFNFVPYIKLDNMCAIFFNLLEAIQQWQIDRLSGPDAASQSFNSYLRVLEMSLVYLDAMSKDNQWFSPCIKYLVLKSKSVMKQAKNAGADSITTTKSLQKLVQQLRDFKSSKNIDLDTKKSFQLMINNLLVSCYLSIRDYTKSKKIIDDKEIQRDLTVFSKSQINNYHFQAARLQIYDRTIEKAVKSLQSIKFTTNRQKHLVLKYMIPCKMYMWKMPNNPSYPQYMQLAQAVMAGNFGKFKATFQKYSMVWIKRGIYELILGLQIFVWRNFLKRLQKYSECETMSVSQISDITKLMGQKINSEDCLFHITNLIGRQYLKGYIYITPDGAKTLVFRIKKGDIFPKIPPM